MTRYTVRYTEAAVAEFQALGITISGESSNEIADSYMEKLRALCDSLEWFPHRGEWRPGLSRGVRSIGFRRRVSVYFKVSDSTKTVVILGIAYAGRRVLGAE